MQRVALPFRGAANNSALRDLPAGYAPVQGLKNFWAHVPGEDRPRGGQRPGLAAFIAEQFGAGDVQAIQEITLTSRVTGFVADPDTRNTITDVDGTPRDAAALQGQMWMLDRVPAMFRDYDDQRGSSESSNAVCWSGDGMAAFFVTNFTDGDGRDVVGLTIVRRDGPGMDDQIVLFDRDKAGDAIPSPSQSLACSTICTDNVFLYLTISQYLYVVRAEDGQHLARYDMEGWAQECVEARVRPDGKIAVAFWGTSNNSDLPAGPNAGEGLLPSGVTVSNGANDWRSGVMLFSVDHDDTADPLTQERFGAVLTDADAFFEADHGYARVSEIGGGLRAATDSALGCKPEALAVGPDNTVVLFSRNKGWGPNGDPQHQPSEDKPKINVRKFGPTGNLLWERDTGSIEAVYNVGWTSFTGTDRGVTDPSILAGVVDDDGLIFCGGARSSIAGANVFAIDTDGTLIGALDLNQPIRQACAAVDPRSGLIVMGGDRNSSWEGASGNNAHLWWIDPLSVSVVKFYDIDEAVSALGVAINPQGEVAYGTDYVT